MRSVNHRWTQSAAVAGIIGPSAFVAAWGVGAVLADDLSPIEDAISRLAAVGATATRPLMTAGFVAFGVAVPTFALVLRRHVPGRAWISALATGVCTLAVAATPLDRSDVVDRLHAVFAGAGYATLAAVPLLAARPLRGAGLVRAARWSTSVAALAGASLVASTAGLPTGLFQRLGLTVVDAWLVVVAVTVLSGRWPQLWSDT